ncbi:hypothetical protein K431DRAFT_253534 [Polychaeton citri CBS 116435]|uniref:CPAF-like PDZ domain-containing protein n=1 Tax=Polychaeton citri CBS 116435 TaxID=1314669 RepID=A0A9P4UMG7_9PEZI|nr:hypothetical protein K431DRAFT_253534 [Polychaeton citri CBS 116435]
MRGRSSILLPLCAPAAIASPWGGGNPPAKGPWQHQSHPGWDKPSPYVPPNPEPTWWGGHHHPSGPGYPSTAVTTATSTSATTTTSPSSNDACASVSELVGSIQLASPSATPTVPAQLAYECITSVPFNQSAAIAVLDSMRPYLNWQTTISYLKDPPIEYVENIQPAYDFYGEFETIYDKTQAGSYANEYEWGYEVYRLFQRAHDGHFAFIPDSVGLIFNFGRQTPLVSVSLDGVSIPEVYVYADVLAATYDNTTFTPSPLTEIDGQDATEYLLNWSQYGSLQDRDALWNNVFYLLGQVSLGPSGTGAGTFAGGGRGRWVYPGPNTTLAFANGSSITTENFARVLVPFDNITSGKDIYEQYFTPPADEIMLAEEIVSSLKASTTVPTSSTSSSTPPTSSATTTTIPAPGYPSPIIREMSNLNSGYFLEGEGYDDVAVLSVPSFVSSDADELPFQSVNTYLIDRAVAEGKKKLIIDVSANGGGTILQGYDLFKQLFPQILPYGATRFRAHEAFDLIGQEASYFSGLVPRSLDTNDTAQEITSSPMNYRSDADVNYEPFTSWPEKFGPHAYGPGPDNFTSIIRWNLSDVLIPDNSGGIYVSGYLNRSNITTQPFAAENIVIVYDGYCASTCTIFSELMRQQAGVKTIALGGRPSRDIIQAVGGVKGTNDYPWDYILEQALWPFEYQYVHDEAYYNSTALGEYSNLPLYRATSVVVNSRDGIREGDETETPLQFVYEPADCRIYYTPAMAVDQTAAWKTVADTAFNGKSHCVAGSYSGNATTYSRRSVSAKHAARRDVNLEEHKRSLDSVWTGKGGKIFEGNGLMLL